MKYTYNLRLRNDSNYSLLIFLRQKEKRKQFNTNIVLKKDQWKNGKVVKHNLQVEYNLQISNYNNTINLYLAKNENHSLDEIINLLSDRSESFIDFINENINEAQEPTRSKHKIALNYLIEFNPDFTFRDIRNEKVNDFINFMKSKTNRKYLKSDKKISNAYINTILSALSKYANQAVKLSLINKNVFLEHKLKVSKKEPIWLTLEEIEKIDSLEIEERREQVKKVKDCFIFACYVG